LILLLLLCFIVIGCALHGFEYSIIEDDEYCLLKGDFFNHNPIIKYKAYFPSSFLIRKNENHFSTSKEIRSTFTNKKIVEGYIVESPRKVEIRLVTQSAPTRQDLAEENGCYELKSRKKVANLMQYMEKEEAEIFKTLH